MGPPAAVRLYLLAAVVLFGACSPAVRSVQLVADPQDARHGRGSPETASPEGLAPDDRLAILRVAYENPLEFGHKLHVMQVYPASKPGNLITSLHVTLDGPSGDRLLLLRFKADGGDTAKIFPYACLSRHALACYGAARDPYLLVKLPPPGGAAYLGRLQLRIEDIYPHRGTRNQPQIKGLVVRDGFDEDTSAAKRRWPVLDGREVVRSPGQIRS